MWRSLLGPGVALRRPGLCGSGRRFAGAKAEPEQHGGCTFDTGPFGTWFIWVQHDETWNASVQVSTAPSDFFLHRCSQIRPTRSEKPKHRRCHGPTLLSPATRCASCGRVRGWTRPVVCKRSRCQWSSHHSLSPSTDHWYPGFNYMTSDALKLAEQAGW